MADAMDLPGGGDHPDLAPPAKAQRAHMVASFLFTEDCREVVLIRKARPQWQAGKLNGIGGHCTPGETGVKAAARELLEEAGVMVDPGRLQLFATLFVDHGPAPAPPGPLVDFFRYRGPEALTAKAMTDERLERHAVAELPWADLVPNVRWLIPLALDRHLGFPVAWQMTDPRSLVGGGRG